MEKKGEGANFEIRSIKGSYCKWEIFYSQAKYDGGKQNGVVGDGEANLVEAEAMVAG